MSGDMCEGHDQPTDLLLNHIFRPEDARFDRIQIERTCGALRGTLAAFRDFKEMLSRGHAIAGNRRVFSAASGRPDGWSKWTVIGGRSSEDTRAQPDAPLFSGSLTAFPSAPYDALVDGHQWELSLRLSLNPSRWLNHEDFWALTRPPRLLRPNMPPDRHDAHATVALRNQPANLFARELPPNRTEDLLLVHGDNASEGSLRRQSLFSSRKRDIHLERYYSGVIDLLDNLIEDTANLAGLEQLPNVRAVKLREIEAYWEVPREDPIGDAQRLEGDIRAAVAECSTSQWRPNNQQARAYLLRQTSTGRLQNSPCIKASVGRGAMLRIYAKTTKRVRFEVEFKARLSPAVFHGFTGGDNSLVDWCRTAANEGSRQITSMCDTIRSSVGDLTTGRPLTAERLLEATCDAAGSINGGGCYPASVTRQRKLRIIRGVDASPGDRGSEENGSSPALPANGRQSPLRRGPRLPTGAGAVASDHRRLSLVTGCTAFQLRPRSLRLPIRRDAPRRS